MSAVEVLHYPHLPSPTASEDDFLASAADDESAGAKARDQVYAEKESLLPAIVTDAAELARFKEQIPVATPTPSVITVVAASADSNQDYREFLKEAADNDDKYSYHKPNHRVRSHGSLCTTASRVISRLCNWPSTTLPPEYNLQPPPELPASAVAVTTVTATPTPPGNSPATPTISYPSSSPVSLLRNNILAIRAHRRSTSTQTVFTTAPRKLRQHYPYEKRRTAFLSPPLSSTTPTPTSTMTTHKTTTTKPTLTDRILRPRKAKAEAGTTTTTTTTKTTKSTTAKPRKMKAGSATTGTGVHHHKRKPGVKDKVSGALLKAKGEITGKSGEKAAGTRRMHGTDGKGSHRTY